MLVRGAGVHGSRGDVVSGRSPGLEVGSKSSTSAHTKGKHEHGNIAASSTLCAVVRALQRFKLLPSDRSPRTYASSILQPPHTRATLFHKRDAMMGRSGRPRSLLHRVVCDISTNFYSLLSRGILLTPNFFSLSAAASTSTALRCINSCTWSISAFLE
jgi:hypothetical protein